MDPETIRKAMLELEHAQDGRTSEDALHDILGVARDGFPLTPAISNEVFRTQILCREHYTRSVAVLPNDHQSFVMMLQGATFAVAVLKLTGALESTWGTGPGNPPV